MGAGLRVGWWWESLCHGGSEANGAMGSGRRACKAVGGEAHKAVGVVGGFMRWWVARLVELRGWGEGL